MSWEDVLSDAKSIEIKQRRDLMEALSGCELENKYDIKIKTDDGDKVKWKAKEKSGCLERQCCDARKKAMEIKVRDEDGDSCFKLVKDFNCDCYCYDLPSIVMKDLENDKTLGRVTAKFSCCPQINVEVLDDKDRMRFYVQSEICPLPMVCRGTLCGLMCQEFTTDVYDNDNKVVATIEKKTRSCLTAAITDADAFKCKFKKDLSNREKALLLATCFIIDYAYFEDNPKRNNNNNM